MLFLLVSCVLGFSGVREKFYIAEEMFLSGEYVKARGVYQSLDSNKLSVYEKNILSYRMAFFTNISNALVFLSNSNLKESLELMNFAVGYISGSYLNTLDLINLGDEVEVYKYLDKVSNTGIFDIDFSLMLYFSLSNLKDRGQVVAKNDFERLKLKFGEGIVKRNLGDDEGYNAVRKYILENYPNSFWAKVFSKGEVVGNIADVEKDEYYLSPGFYVVVSEKLDVIKEFLTLKNYKVFEVNKNIYVGPYYNQLEAQREAEKISRDYRVSAKVVQVRIQ